MYVEAILQTRLPALPILQVHRQLLSVYMLPYVSLSIINLRQTLRNFIV